MVLRFLEPSVFGFVCLAFFSASKLATALPLKLDEDEDEKEDDEEGADDREDITELGKESERDIVEIGLAVVVVTAVKTDAVEEKMGVANHSHHHIFVQGHQYRHQHRHQSYDDDDDSSNRQRHHHPRHHHRCCSLAIVDDECEIERHEYRVDLIVQQFGVAAHSLTSFEQEWQARSRPTPSSTCKQDGVDDDDNCCYYCNNGGELYLSNYTNMNIGRRC